MSLYNLQGDFQIERPSISSNNLRQNETDLRSQSIKIYDVFFIALTPCLLAASAWAAWEASTDSDPNSQWFCASISGLAGIAGICLGVVTAKMYCPKR